jgi:hypothetical protein
MGKILILFAGYAEIANFSKLWKYANLYFFASKFNRIER